MEQKTIAEYQSTDGKFTYKILEGAGFYVLAQTGAMRVEDARHLTTALVEVRNRLGKRYGLLMPLPAEFTDVMPEARKTMADVVLGRDSPFVKFSIYGGSFVMRTMFNLYGRISKVPLRLFATQEEAEAWLNQ